MITSWQLKITNTRIRCHISIQVIYDIIHNTRSYGCTFIVEIIHREAHVVTSSYLICRGTSHRIGGDHRLTLTALIRLYTCIHNHTLCKSIIVSATTCTLLLRIQSREHIITIAVAIPSPVDMQITTAQHTITYECVSFVCLGTTTDIQRMTYLQFCCNCLQNILFGHKVFWQRSNTFIITKVGTQTVQCD